MNGPNVPSTHSYASLQLPVTTSQKIEEYDWLTIRETNIIQFILIAQYHWNN